MASSGFSCGYCSSWFKTKIGLGVHKQEKRREQYQAEISIPKSKTRWSDDELAVVARQEAILLSQGKTAEMKTQLLPLFPNRAREAIKGQRRQRKYKDLVDEYSQDAPPTCSSDRIGSGSDRSSALPSSCVPVNPVILDPVSCPFDPGAVERSPPGSAPTVTVPEPSMTSRRVIRSQTKHPPGVEPEVT
ncbi:hypothetical protein AVEN_80356-1, partial [Araneus ventricosus]